MHAEGFFLPAGTSVAVASSSWVVAMLSGPRIRFSVAFLEARARRSALVKRTRNLLVRCVWRVRGVCRSAILLECCYRFSDRSSPGTSVMRRAVHLYYRNRERYLYSHTSSALRLHWRDFKLLLVNRLRRHHTRYRPIYCTPSRPLRPSRFLMPLL